MKTGWDIVKNSSREMLCAYVRQSSRMIVSLLLIILLHSIASILSSYLFSNFINDLSKNGKTEYLLFMLAIYAVLIGLAHVLKSMVQNLSMLNSEEINFLVGTNFFRKILRKNSVFFSNHNPAEIENIQATGKEALNIFIQLALAVFIPNFIQITLSVVVLGVSINMYVMAIVSVYGSIFIFISYYVNIVTRSYINKAILLSQDNARLGGNVSNAHENIKYAGSENWLSQNFDHTAREVRGSWRFYFLKRIVFSFVYGTALTMQFLICFYYILPRYRLGIMSVGDIVLFNSLVLQLNQPFEMVGQAIDDINRCYFRFLPFARMWSENEISKPISHKSFALTHGKIEFKDVSFSYENGRGVRNVSFTVQRGCINYLVGETGSGKSTIINLLLKSIEQETGSIRVDGMDLRDIDQDSWYPLVGVVRQDVSLLNDDIRTNIVLGRLVNDMQVRKVTERAAILDFIESLPDGFETRVGERGLKLSGGERQQIAIARALYAEPQILVFDEASSALDEATERHVMSHIRAITNDVTVLVITHRENIIMPEDNIIIHE